MQMIIVKKTLKKKNYQLWLSSPIQHSIVRHSVQIANGVPCEMDVASMYFIRSTHMTSRTTNTGKFQPKNLRVSPQ